MRPFTRSLALGGVVASQAALMHTTTPTHQLQRPDLTVETHGGGLTNMEAQSSSGTPVASFGNNTFSRYRPSAPPADLFLTPVHEGLGTNSRGDPYTRTLPNVEMREPPSTVSSTAAHHAAMQSHGRLERDTRLPLGVWLSSGLLAQYVSQHLKMTLPSPVSANAIGELEKFKGAIPELCEGTNRNPDILRQQWTAATTKFFTIPPDVFNPEKFAENVRAARRGCIAVFSAKAAKASEGPGGDANVTADDDIPVEALLCIDHLVKMAVDLRNKMIDAEIGKLTDPNLNTAKLLDGGNAVWRVLLNMIENNKAVLLGEEENDAGIFSASEKEMIKAQLQWVQSRQKPSPSVSAPVALHLILVATHLAAAPRQAWLEATKSAVRRAFTPLPSIDAHLRGDEKVTATQVSGGISDSTKKALARKYLDILLAAPTTQFLEAMKTHFKAYVDPKTNKPRPLPVGHKSHEHLIAEVALLIADKTAKDAIVRNEAAEFIPLFAAAAPVKAVLAQVASTPLTTGAEIPRSRFRRLLQLAREDQLVELPNVKWNENYEHYARVIMEDHQLTKYLRHAINKVLEGNAQLSDGILSRKVRSQFDSLIAKREKRMKESETRLSLLRTELLAHKELDRTVEMLLDAFPQESDKASGLLKELHSAAEGGVDSSQSSNSSLPIPAVSTTTVHNSLQLVRARHPHWVPAGILPPDSAPPASTALATLATALRIYLRLCYVPQTFEATMQGLLRGRIGAIGKASHEHNIAVEVGKTEHYDTHLYKTYDPQGWYQRMRDIDNRNVSIKARISDLCSVDESTGVPLIDLQTERRLRILAGDKVGNGVIKMDSDRYEDASDNESYGTLKFQQVLSEAKKAQLGPEYWPTVEVKVRRPSGQSRSLQSLIDYDRVEARSKVLYEEYRDMKKKVLFVSPTETYLRFNAASGTETSGSATSGFGQRGEDGYVVDAHALENELSKE